MLRFTTFVYRVCCCMPSSFMERNLMEPGDETETHQTTERPTSTFPEPASNRPMDELMRAIGVACMIAFKSQVSATFWD
ncbi:hypothetical protein PGTUg99_014592 [Puccinia graminis f. sp. tritici]|uniref:Uncharacterized protein n=1 Tax=Puccinia graminis f. sp. tritici TaxID=56615 RepID=A0A5B0PWA9_PUCGR|nr:hypothetical protein PGTUg99_014592 [Puccinia graminis f. sp. tritici]